MRQAETSAVSDGSERVAAVIGARAREVTVTWVISISV
jgi:hypothetical protein